MSKFTIVTELSFEGVSFELDIPVGVLEMTSISLELDVQSAEMSAISFEIEQTQRLGLNSEPSFFSVGILTGTDKTGLTSLPFSFSVGYPDGTPLLSPGSAADFKVVFRPALKAISFRAADTGAPWNNRGPALLGVNISVSHPQAVQITPDLGWANVQDMFEHGKNSQLTGGMLSLAADVSLTQPTDYNFKYKSLNNLIFYVQDDSDSIFKYFTLDNSIHNKLLSHGAVYLWRNSSKPNNIHRFRLVLHPGGIQ